MKKTLMVLTFALCATFGFAQTNNSARAIKAMDRSASVKPVIVNEQNTGYNGSIFTKDGELFTTDFGTAATNYSTGYVTGGQIGGTNATVHAQTTAYHAQWRRWNDTTMATVEAQAQSGNYPRFTMYNGSVVNRLRYFSSATPNDGVMVMTMVDQSTLGNTGSFNAYIAFNPFSTVGNTLIDVRFYQYYQKFNRDQCFIDYSTNGTTWNTFEINVKNVDLAVNSATRSWKRVTMPAACGNQANLYLRLRWESTSNVGGVYGYWWIVDDFSVVAAPNNRLTAKSNEHFEGFYHQLPQGLNLPLVWHANYINDGQSNQTNVTGLVRGWMDGATETDTYVSKNYGAVASDPAATNSITIDPMGWYDTASTSNGLGFTGDPNGNFGYLPTANVGVGHFFTDITTSTLDHIGDSITFDTLRFEVNYDNNYHNGKAIWGRDNTLVGRGSYFTPGCMDGNEDDGYVWSPEYSDGTYWDQAGYGAFVSYVTGPQIPAGWRVLGVEMVASTEEGLTAPGAKLIPYLFRDSIDAEDGGLSFYYMNTGASTYTVTANDLISESPDYEYMTFMTPADDYPTVFIPFPEQPELLPSSSYRIGYRLAQEGNFACATSSNGYYDADGAWHYYFNESGMKAYGNVLTVDNYYSSLTYCPYASSYFLFPVDEYAMIRMVVGPGFYVPHFAVSFECDNEDEGYFANGRNESLCGLTDSVAQGGSFGAYIYPAEGYTVDKVWLDGVEVTDYEWDETEGYGYIELQDVQAAHTLRCSFKIKTGIDPVAAGVSMKLQPNPATSNVNVSLKGVSGNVNMSLIDMSGRVITTSTFNAENGTNINVSNLAKGAYFVRITNDKFSKVEKLIVR